MPYLYLSREMDLLDLLRILSLTHNSVHCCCNLYPPAGTMTPTYTENTTKGVISIEVCPRQIFLFEENNNKQLSHTEPKCHNIN